MLKVLEAKPEFRVMIGRNMAVVCRKQAQYLNILIYYHALRRSYE